MSTVPNPIDSISIDLQEIQGNILAGFNKDHQRFVFFTIEHVGRAKNWLAGFASHVDSTAAVGAFNDVFRAKRKKHKGEVNMPTATWRNIAFSYAGLEKLGAPDHATFPDDFKQGMAARKTLVGDLDRSDPSRWHGPFKKPQELHIVVMVASDIPGELAHTTDQIIAHAQLNGLRLLHVEHGEVRPDLPGHEQFGFKDGVSQPGIKGFTLSVNDQPDPNSGHQGVPGQDLLWPGEFVLGYPTQIPTTPPPPFDGPNPGQGPISASGPDWTKNGSYLVFRKLRQDVAGFMASVAAHASTLGLSADAYGAKLVGRYASGCPLAPTSYEVDLSKLPELAPSSANGFPSAFDPNDGDPSVQHPELLDDNLINNFEYGQDLPGTWVPRAAHIRKAYPRDEEFLLADGTVDPNSALQESFTQTRRLLRRGIAYGAPLALPKDPGTPVQDDDVDRGLLFLCYQKSIESQFEFVQKTWIDNPDFPQSGDGEDPLISQTKSATMTCPIHGASTTETLSHFVVTEGGEYFFQPSITALKLIAGS